jgi:hypothetical protein
MIPSFGYDDRVALKACPFCREMFEAGEHEECPVCGVALAAFEKLPPSIDAMNEDGVPTAPELETLPLTDLGRGKGVLVGIAFVGLVMFFLPWVHITLPYIDSRSAFDIAHGRAGWLWGAGSAWLVLIPTVLSRRSIAKMRGARVAAAFLAAIPGVCVADLVLFRPKYDGYVPVHLSWAMPLWVTLALSIVGIGFAMFTLGGSMSDIRVSRGTSVGQDLH